MLPRVAGGCGGVAPSGTPGALKPYLSSPLCPLLAPSHAKPEEKIKNTVLQQAGRRPGLLLGGGQTSKKMNFQEGDGAGWGGVSQT